MNILSIIKKEKKEENENRMIPFTNYTKIVVERNRRYVFFIVFLMSIIGVFMIFQEIRLQNLTLKTQVKEYLVIPGAVDFMNVRPNLIPKESVFSFANYIITLYGNFSYVTYSSNMEEIGKYGSPEFVALLSEEVKKNEVIYKSLEVSELISFDKIKEYNIRTEEDKGYFVLSTAFSKKRYSGKTQVNEEKFMLELELVSSEIKPNSPWFLAIKSLRIFGLNEYKIYQETIGRNNR